MTGHNLSMTDAYLGRIGFAGSRAATLLILRALHERHLQSVPFENLDICEGRPIVLSRERLFDKIVARRRGGFCYELNGLFAWLLEGLGFDVTLLSARVSGSNGVAGPGFDHMAMMVKLHGRRWLADVGFGDSFVFPLDLDTRSAQDDPAGSFRIDKEGPQYTLSRLQRAGSWKDQYRFTLAPRELHDFTAMCDYHQTSPHSSFTRKTICSRRTADGRISLTADRLIVSTSAAREETPIEDRNAWRAALREFFGIVLN